MPHLAKYLADQEFVIDVGANCGDTLASMVTTNNNLNFICVEPDENFIKYLKNTVKIIQEKLSCKIITSQSLAGKDLKSVILEGKNGTKHAVLTKKSNNTISSEYLDDITLKNLKPLDKISLLKVDVDGFDYDVLNSSKKIISKYEPLLFFECDFQNSTQKENYEMTIKSLQNSGYTEWSIFDNFGSFLLQTSEVKHIFDIFNYVWAVKSKKTTKTICYVDILASRKDKKFLIEKVLNSYL